MERKVYSVRVNTEIWKKAKKFAIDRDLTMGQLVESALIHEIQQIQRK